MQEKLTKEQADLVWKKFEQHTDKMIEQNKKIEVGDYQSGFEDALVEMRCAFEVLLTQLEK